MYSIYNIVTPVSRPENLSALYLSVAEQGQEFWNRIIWWLVYDGVPIVEKSLNPTGSKEEFEVKSIYTKIPGSVSGNAQRNIAIDNIQNDSWIWFLDDDNIMYPNFLKTIEAQINSDSNIKGLIFNQLNKDKTLRLKASPENTKVNHIDTAQFIINKNIIDNEFQIDLYNADGLFIEDTYNQHRDKFKFIDEPLCYYNYLRG